VASGVVVAVAPSSGVAVAASPSTFTVAAGQLAAVSTTGLQLAISAGTSLAIENSQIARLLVSPLRPTTSNVTLNRRPLPPASSA